MLRDWLKSRHVENRHFCLITVDADRDYPIHRKGQIEAVSAVSEDSPDNPAVSLTVKGLEILLDLFEELDIQGTFFIEASILAPIKAEQPDLLRRLKRNDIGNHGYAHEDFTGELTGIPLTRDQIEEILKKAISTVIKYVKKPLGFRAPYLKFNRYLGEKISELFEYDSSITLKQAISLNPGRINGLSIAELPLITTKDVSGKPISTYLWQLLEGNRTVKEYLRIVEEKKRDSKFPFTIFALHPWHIAYHIGKKEILTNHQLKENVNNLREFLVNAGPFGKVEDALNIIKP